MVEVMLVPAAAKGQTRTSDMETSITFSLKYVSRALTALQADKLQSKWVVGTNALREENEVREVRASLCRIAACAQPDMHLLRRSACCNMIKTKSA